MFMFNRIRNIVLVLAIIVAFNSVSRAAQFARPDGTLAAGDWTPAVTLHEQVDEVTADGDGSYALAASSTTAELSLSDVTDPGVDTGHIMRISFMTLGGAGAPEKISFALYQDTIKIAEQKNLENPDSYGSPMEFPLDALTEANLITDYSLLKFTIVSSGISGSDSIRVSWVELEVPDASGATEPTLLDPPTVQSIDTNSATLGATIDSDGGDAVTSRGTVWDTSATPRLNLLAEGGTAVGVPY